VTQWGFSLSRDWNCGPYVTSEFTRELLNKPTSFLCSWSSEETKVGYFVFLCTWHFWQFHFINGIELSVFFLCCLHLSLSVKRLAVKGRLWNAYLAYVVAAVLKWLREHYCVDLLYSLYMNTSPNYHSEFFFDVPISIHFELITCNIISV